MLQRFLCCLLVLAAVVETVRGQETPYLKAKSTAASGGPTLVEIVQIIADETSGLTVVTNSVSTAINATGSPPSDARALGNFWDGTVAPGTLLPTNQPDPQNPTATYAGGIGIASGVSLCTSVTSDTDGSPSSERGLGVEGPNNGEPQVNPGEITTRLFTPIDEDFVDFVFDGIDPGGGDATVLQFDVTLESPGLLRISFAFGSDEYPAWINQEFNDSFAVLIRKCGAFENIATLKSPGQEPEPFNLHDVFDCGPPIFKENQVAPAPETFLTSEHAIKNEQGEYDTSIPYFDHEFGGFTKM